MKRSVSQALGVGSVVGRVVDDEGVELQARDLIDLG